MSSTTPRQRLGRLFNRRDASTGTSEAAPHGPPPVTENREGRHVRRKTSLGSLREFVQNTGRSLSRTRKSLKREHSRDVPAPPEQQPRNGHSGFPHEGLPPIVHQTDLASDLAHLVLNDPLPSNRPRLSSAGEHPALRRKIRKLSDEIRGDVLRTSRPSVIHIDTRMEPVDDPYSESVTDWNLPHYEKPLIGALDDLPAPLKVTKSRSSDLSGSPGSRYMPGQLSHKPDFQDLRRAIEKRDESGGRRGSDQERRSIRKSSLNKPLPELPLPLDIHEPQSMERELYAHAVERELEREPGYLIKDSTEPIDVKDFLDLSNTEDTQFNTIWSPAVTREERQVNIHEITQQAISREIHNHHIFHRILPVTDIEVLPARHFIPTEDGGLEEISSQDVQADSTDRLQQLISEAVANMMPKTDELIESRQFSAREFSGDDGDYKEYTTPEGLQRTEQWWVHPPTVETSAGDDGQTAPFDVGSDNPTDDGLRDEEIASPMFAEQPYASQSSWDAATTSNKDYLPADYVPIQHTILPIRMTQSVY